MSPTQTTVIVTLFNIFLIAMISFSFAIIIKKHVKIHVYFYFPFGLLAFLGISYILTYPFIIFRWPAIFYQLLLFLIFIIGLVYACYIVIKEDSYQKINKKKVLSAFFCVLFIIFIMFQASNHTLAENAFDSVFYTTFVTNNVNPSIMGYTNYDSNTILTSIDTQYAFSSFYYFNAFLIKIAKTIMPKLNEILYSPIYIWQASFMLAALTITSLLNIGKALIKKNEWGSFLLLFSIIGIFYGSQYYNTALAFIGNSFRPIIMGNIMLITFLLFEKEENQISSFTLLMLCIASLIAFSSSGFFISAFFLYAYFYVLLDTKKALAFAITSYISIPMLLFLFAYLFGPSTLVLTPIAVTILYSLSKLNNQISGKIIRIFQYLIRYIIPATIIIAVLLFRDIFKVDYMHFFLVSSDQDMVWNYFSNETHFHIIINFILLFFFVILFFAKDKVYPLAKIMRTIFFTFLNPFVIPFTILFFTNVVFYRGFDLFFNPFTITYAIVIITNKLSKLKIKQNFIVLLCIPFLLYGINNFNQHYHYYFTPNSNYNRVLKITNGEFEALDFLNHLIKTEHIDSPIIVSQIYQTLGSIPHINMPYSSQAMRSNSFKWLTVEQANLLNVFSIHAEPPGPEWIISSYNELEKILNNNHVSFAIVAHGSNYYDPEEDRYYYLVEEMEKYFIPIYENDYYVIFRNPNI